MSSRWNVSLALLVAGALIGPAVKTASPHIPIPPKKGDIGRKTVNTPLPDFALIDQNGKPFRLTDARGKLIVATFIFTTCPDFCPLLSAKFAAIQRALDEKKQPDVLLLSITTDPEVDTAVVLKRYAEIYKADPARWLFLTGPQERLTKVWSDFGVNVKKAGPGQVQHTALTTIIDRGGTRRFDYYTDKWHEKSVLRDLESLAANRR